MCRFGLPVTSTCFSDHCNLIPIPEHVNHVRFPLRTIFDAKYASLVPNTANGEKMERKFVNEMKYRKEILNGWEKKNAISGFWCKKYAPFLWLKTLLSHFDRIIVEWMQTVDSYQPICITESEEERKKTCRHSSQSIHFIQLNRLLFVRDIHIKANHLLKRSRNEQRKRKKKAHTQ